jgi:hypothetical protein
MGKLRAQPVLAEQFAREAKTRRLHDTFVSADAAPGGGFLRNSLMPSWMGAKTARKNPAKIVSLIITRLLEKG